MMCVENKIIISEGYVYQYNGKFGIVEPLMLWDKDKYADTRFFDYNGTKIICSGVENIRGIEKTVVRGKLGSCLVNDIINLICAENNLICANSESRYFLQPKEYSNFIYDMREVANLTNCKRNEYALTPFLYVSEHRIVDIDNLNWYLEEELLTNLMVSEIISTHYANNLLFDFKSNDLVLLYAVDKFEYDGKNDFGLPIHIKSKDMFQCVTSKYGLEWVITIEFHGDGIQFKLFEQDMNKVRWEYLRKYPNSEIFYVQ
jgi:hypothetical protein